MSQMASCMDLKKGITMVEWNAADYHKNSASQQNWAHELIEKLQIKGDERILDIGCGDGKITAEIAQMVPDGSVVGIDSSAEMVSFAGKSFTAPNLTFMAMDARSLTFENECDIVFSNATLHWVVDHRPVLQGISRALTNGGKCLLQMGGKGNAAMIIDTILSKAIEERWGHYFAEMSFPYGFYSPDQYVPWMQEAGLTPVRVELIPRDMVQNGPDGLAGWIRTTWMPFTHRIPEDLCESFITDVVQEYIAKHPLDDKGLVHVPMVRLEVEAVKR